MLSPWSRLVAKEIQFETGGASHSYHCLTQADYVVILAQTRAGTIPIVRQFRPAVEQYTWELPGGLVDPGEAPEISAKREILEETGMRVESMHPLGEFFPDTGRLENRMHSFYARLSDPVANFIPEPGIEVEFVTAQRLVEMTLTKQFRHQLHFGVLLLAQFLIPELKWPSKPSA